MRFFCSFLSVVYFSAISAAAPAKSDKIVEKLDNGTLLVIQKNREPKKGLSARVLAKRGKGSSKQLSLSEEGISSLWPLLTAEQMTLAYEGSSQDLQKFDQFLAYCSEKFGKTKSPFPIDYQYVKSQVSCIDQRSLRPQPLQKEIDAFASSQMWERPIVVICGDIPAESMKTSAENWFSPLHFSSSSLKTSIRPVSTSAMTPPSHVGITYEIPSGSKGETLLTRSWKGLIASEILIKRLSDHPTPSFSVALTPLPPIPTSSLNFVFQSQDSSSTDLVESVLSQIEFLCAEPILASEFKNAKASALERLAQIRNQIHGAPSSRLANYLLAIAQLGEEKTDLSSFVRRSQEILQTLSFGSFSAEFPLFFTSPALETPTASETPIASSATFPSQRRKVGSIQTGTEVDHYHSLPITEKEKEMIYTIISTMAENNVITLAFKRSELDHLGKKIHHVHPMRFLGTVFSNPHLKKCMEEIADSHFKWNGFIDGFGARMEGEADRHNLHRYVRGLCKAIKADHDLVAPYIDHRNWEGLVKHLIRN